MSHLIHLIMLIAGSVFCCAVLAEPVRRAPQVLGWVPAYGLQTSMAALELNPAIARGLTRLGLQLEAKNWRNDVTWQAIRVLRRQPGEGWTGLTKD